MTAVWQVLLTVESILHGLIFYSWQTFNCW